MTIISLTLAMGGNLLAWALIIWISITNQGWPINEIPHMVAPLLFLFVNFPGFLIALAATRRNESRFRLRQIVYVLSLVSSPLYYLATGTIL